MSRISSSLALVLVLAPMVGCRPAPGVPSRPAPATVSDGYGDKAKEQSGGVPSVSFENAPNKKNVARVEELLEGIPGLQVQRAGNGYSVTLRGVGSFSASEQVLFVIDGTPHQGSLAWLNPQDVVRIDVLKNASDTAIYGLRGANGVVVISTKRKGR